MKKGLSSLLRKCGLLHVSDKIRFKIHQSRYRQANNDFIAKHSDFVFPPPYLMYESFGMDYSRYYEGGKITANWVNDHLSKFIALNNARVLDWGCGPARVIRHLPDVMGGSNEYFGTDVNKQSIHWNTNNLRDIQFAHNSADPPLGYESDFFDAIYGISIFTHLSEENHKNWFREHMRVLKKGGVLMVTTHGINYLEIMTASEQEKYRKGNIVVRSGVTEGHRMYTAFQPEKYMRELANGIAEIVLHTVGQKEDYGIEQDVWIFKKLG